MKKIIIPTDFSANARHAADYAMQLFKDEPCEFILLNAFGIGNTTNMMLFRTDHPAYEAALIQSQKALKSLFNVLHSSRVNKAHSFDMVAGSGTLTEAIKTLIDTRDIYMVILGTRGATKTMDKWFGSNAVSVIEYQLACPVLAIPEMAPVKNPENIVFPTSFRRRYRKKDLAPLLYLAQKFKSCIQLLHVDDKENLNETQLDNKACLKVRLQGIPNTYHALTNIDPGIAIRCFTESRENTDMIALMNRKRSPFGEMFRKPVISRVGHYTRLPLLVMSLSSGR